MLLMDRPFEEALPLASTSILLCSLRVALPLIGMVMAVALCANLMQVGVLFSVQAAMPKLENLSMGKWFKQVFSLKNLVEFLKNIIKVPILGVSVYVHFFRLHAAAVPHPAGRHRRHVASSRSLPAASSSSSRRACSASSPPRTGASRSGSSTSST